MDKIKPTLVLMIITTIMASMLIVANTQLAVDPNQLTDDLREKCVELMGEGEYTVVVDWLEAGYNIERPKAVTKLIVKDDGQIALQVVASGYEKNGLDMLFAMNDDGSIKAIAMMTNNETPGLGTKVNREEFLGLFVGKSEEVSIGKGADQIDAVTGATRSSKGVAAAVNTAITVFKEMGAVN